MNTEALEVIESIETVGHFINGRMVADNTRTQDIFNPATGRVVRQVALAGKATVEEAITAAEAAFPAWRNTSPIKRARIMFRFKELLEQNADKVVALITQEHGKVLNDSHGEFLRAVEVVEFMCGVPELLKGEHTKDVGTGIDSWSERQPLGVCAGITPFNFPVMVPFWMMIPSIACGNTFVLKPSEKDPSSIYRAIELLKEAGLPDGVINIVNGDKEAVDTLLTDPRIQSVEVPSGASIPSRSRIALKSRVIFSCRLASREISRRTRSSTSSTSCRSGFKRITSSTESWRSSSMRRSSLISAVSGIRPGLFSPWLC